MSAARGDRERTLAAMQRHGWEIVKLQGRSKKPSGSRWEITTDPALVGTWLDAGHNIGLVCHQRTHTVVLDPDHVAWADMVDCLGQPCLPWVLTGSGKLHYYCAWIDHLPPKLEWLDTIIGEIQRGPGQQQVALPPSIHPDTGLPYRWITAEAGLPFCEPIDPTGALPTLAGEWRAYLTGITFEREWRRGRRQR